jgi:hypothetical protein
MLYRSKLFGKKGKNGNNLTVRGGKIKRKEVRKKRKLKKPKRR